jgi:long-chain acyl-CoA synthetase
VPELPSDPSADPVAEPAYGVSAHARARPGAVALVAGDRRITYGELDGRINRAARALAALGLGRDDRVLIAARNRPEHLEAAFGAARLRAQVVPAPWRSTADEVAYLVADAGVSVVVAEPESRSATAHSGAPVLHLGDEWEAALGAQSDVPLEDAPRLDYVYRHAYTSGTTGHPKAIELPGFSPRHALANTLEFQERFGVDGPDHVVLAVSPMHHLAGWSYPHSALTIGQTTVLVDGFDPEEVLALIERERVTYANFVPLHFVRFAALDPAVADAFDLSSVHVVLHGSAPCPVDVKWRMFELFSSAEIWETYGGSEGLASVISPAEWRAHPGSVGLPVNEVRILDGDGTELPVGERGLVYLAPNAGVRFTYRGDPDGSAAIWRDDLFTLGDIGYLDADGFLYLVDRAKDVIVTGGANVYPAEVETVLREHPDVREVAVIGVPDAEWGERVHAVVSVRRLVAPDALLAFCRERLVKAKCPTSVEMVDALPRDPMGKVRKRELRERHWAGETRRI